MFVRMNALEGSADAPIQKVFSVMCMAQCSSWSCWLSLAAGFVPGWLPLAGSIGNYDKAVITQGGMDPVDWERDSISSFTFSESKIGEYTLPSAPRPVLCAQ